MESTSSNLLQGTRGLYYSCWKQHEVAIWSRSIRQAVVISMIVGTGIRLLGQAKIPSSDRNWTIISFTLAVFFASLTMLIDTQLSQFLTKFKNVLFLLLCQCYCVFMVLYVFPNCFSLWCVNSTVLFCMYEIPSFRDWWIVVLLLFRQFGMWQGLSMYLEKGSAGPQFPYFMVFGMAFAVLIFTNEKRKRTIERYKFCDSIQEQEAKMKNILQAIPEGLAVVTEKVDVPCFNTNMSAILEGQNDENQISQMLAKLHCCDSEGNSKGISLLEMIKAFIGNVTKEAETFGVTKREVVYYEWKGTKCVWGDTTACILTVSDISSWVTARVKLQQESDSKTALLRFVSHELRTPTNAILNLVANVKAADNINPEQKLDLEIVLTSTQFLLSVINDLLDFSKIVADKFALVKQTFDVWKELSETVQLIELQCRQKGLFLGTKIDNFVPQFIFSDPNRLKQVLLNLLGNALKFTFKGGIRVICNMTDHNSLKITVKDSGIGIPASKIPGLGQLFGTIDGTQRINPQGSGLGLYISNSLALRLGKQSIGIRSKEGIGSEFFFEVSIYQEEVTGEGRIDTTTADIEDEREIETTVCMSPFIGGKGATITILPDVLVVDDSDFNRVVLSKLLETLEVTTDLAITGLRALSLIRNNVRRGHCYRLILMDVEMPEMDGITATEEIRAMELTGQLPLRPLIIACSAHRSQEDHIRCLRAGMDGILEKPISLSRLTELINSLGGQQHRL